MQNVAYTPPTDNESEGRGTLVRRNDLLWAPRERLVGRALGPGERKRFYTWQELSALPPPEWLISRKLPKDALARLFGPPGVGKTFVALDMALPLAVAGQLVVYVAGEGKPGIPKRVRAWLTEHGMPDHPLTSFIVHDGPVDMLSRPEVDKFIRGLGEYQPALVILDTLARCFNGGDENSAKDMGTFIAHCDLIKSFWPGCSVLFIHHTGKDATKGGRGSSAGLGAVDVDMELSRGQSSSPLKLTCSKMKDDEPFNDEIIVLAAAHGSCVVRQAAGTTMPAGAAKTLALVAEGERITVGEWWQRFQEAGISKGVHESQRKMFNRHLQPLRGSGAVVQVSGTPDSGLTDDTVFERVGAPLASHSAPEHTIVGVPPSPTRH